MMLQPWEKPKQIQQSTLSLSIVASKQLEQQVDH